MMGDKIDGNFRGTKVLDVGFVVEVVICEVPGLFDCIGSRWQENAKLRSLLEEMIGTIFSKCSIYRCSVVNI